MSRTLSEGLAAASDHDVDVFLSHVINEKLRRLEVRAYFSRREAIFREVLGLLSRRADEIKHGETPKDC